MATDAALATPPTGTLKAPVRVLRSDATRTTRRSSRWPSGPPRADSRTARSSPSPTSAWSWSSGGLELYADGQLRDSRTLRLDPQRRTDVSIDDIDDPDHPASVIEVRLAAKDEAPARSRTRSGVDDRAWAIVPPGAPADPPGRRRRPVPRDGAALPARHGALRRHGDEYATVTGPTSSSWSSSTGSCRRRCPPSRSSPSRRPETSAPGHRDRHADEPGHRDARPGRPDPALRRPLDGPRRRGAEARAAGVGARR